MSGFEIIGVVLAVWPVVMNAISLYKATKGGRGVESLRIQLDTEAFIFRQFVSNLLSSDVAEADLIQISASNGPNTSFWRDKGLHSKLETRLGPDGTRVVQSNLEEISRLLTGLRDRFASVDTADPKSSRDRVKTGLNQLKLLTSSFKEDLENIKWHNNGLERLFTNRTSPGYAAQGKQPNALPRLSPDILRQNSVHANELYDALYDSFHCQCASPHDANLGLRLDDPKLSDPSKPFEVIFPAKYTSEELSEMDVKCYSPSEISMMGALTESSWDLTSFHSRRWSCSRTNSITPSPPQEKLCRSVAFDSQSSLIDVENVGLIRDLCKFVQDLDDPKASRAQNSCLGVLGANEKKYTVKITSVDDDLSTHHSIVCLDDCLVPTESWQLSRRTRMDLALSLSLAILQFYSTPWIDGWWTWKDFCMLKGEKSQVFINRKFYSDQSPHISRQASHVASTSDFWELYGEPVLTRLGFALVELALGKRLSQLRQPSDNPGIDEDMLDLKTAKRVVKIGLVLEEAGPIYNDAVKACLEHQVIMPSNVVGLKSEHKNFQRDLEEYVVGPLRHFHAVSWPQDLGSA